MLPTNQNTLGLGRIIKYKLIANQIIKIINIY